LAAINASATGRAHAMTTAYPSSTVAESAPFATITATAKLKCGGEGSAGRRSFEAAPGWDPTTTKLVVVVEGA